MSSPHSNPARRGCKRTKKPNPHDQLQEPVTSLEDVPANTWNQAIDQSGWDVPDTSYLDPRTFEHQDRVDGLNSLIPFWLEGVNAAERGEEVSKMGEFYDRMDKREQEMKHAWNSGTKDDTGWGSSANQWGASADANPWGASGGWGVPDNSGWDQPADTTGWDQPPETSHWGKPRNARGANPSSQRKPRWRGGQQRSRPAKVAGRGVSTPSPARDTRQNQV